MRETALVGEEKGSDVRRSTLSHFELNLSHEGQISGIYIGFTLTEARARSLENQAGIQEFHSDSPNS